MIMQINERISILLAQNVLFYKFYGFEDKVIFSIFFE